MKEDIICALKSRTVYLPGGHDRENRILIVVCLTNELEISNKKCLETCINYIKRSLREEQYKKNGLAVILDGQKCSNRITRCNAKIIYSLFGNNIDITKYLVRPEGFWGKSVDHCTKSYAKGEPIVISKSRLQKYFEICELPEELGGTLAYNHDIWIQKRVKIEEFREKFDKIINDIDNLHKLMLDHKSIKPLCGADSALKSCAHLYSNVQLSVSSVIENGNLLLTNLSDGYRFQISNDTNNSILNTTSTISSYKSCNSTINTNTNSNSNNCCLGKMPQDIKSEITEIQKMLNEIEKKQSEISNQWNDLEKSIQDYRELLTLEEGVSFVTNWILGTAEQMLNKQRRIGCDVTTNEELRREHEQLEMKCVDTYGFYAELLYRINSYPSSSKNKETFANTDLSAQKDFMDFVCRIFATRIERRRNTLITALRFYRLVTEYFDKTSEVFESLVMGNKVEDFNEAEGNLRKLKDSQQSLEFVEKELIKEGEKLSDMLAMPIKDALGRDLNIDYSDDIANIRDILDATIARRNIFIDSVELQKLTLEQVHHIHKYEEDAKMAIKWMDDLYNVMIKCHSHVGCNVHEIQVQKDDLQTFQETGKNIYNYGCQLLEASQSLRQSCKLDTEITSGMVNELRRTWHNLQIISQEHMVRLRVSAVFHRSVEEYCIKLHDLKTAVSAIGEIEEPERRRSRIRKYLAVREHLLVEVGRMVRLGRLLKTRLKEPFILCDINSISTLTTPTTVNIKESSNDSFSSEPSSTITSTNQSINLEPALSTLSTTTSSNNNNNNGTTIIPTGNNAIACDAITNKLTNISEVAESLDATLRSTQNGLDIVETNSSSSEKKADHNRTSSLEEWSSSVRSTEDESFLTASEGHFTPQSRSSSFQTASEARTSPYWSLDKSPNSCDITTDGEEISEIDLDANLAFPKQLLVNSFGNTHRNGMVTSSANASFDSSDHSFLSARQSNSNRTPSVSGQSTTDEPPAIPKRSPIYHNGKTDFMNENKSRSQTPTPIIKEIPIQLSTNGNVHTLTRSGAKSVPVNLQETTKNDNKNNSENISKVRKSEINNVKWETENYYRSNVAKQAIKGCL